MVISTASIHEISIPALLSDTLFFFFLSLLHCWILTIAFNLFSVPRQTDAHCRARNHNSRRERHRRSKNQSPRNHNSMEATPHQKGHKRWSTPARATITIKPPSTSALQHTERTAGNPEGWHGLIAIRMVVSVVQFDSGWLSGPGFWLKCRRKVQTPLGQEEGAPVAGWGGGGEGRRWKVRSECSAVVCDTVCVSAERGHIACINGLVIETTHIACCSNSSCPMSFLACRPDITVTDDWA